ncbi:MAG: GMC family oxidoreductase N-terminal domain-containing protein [Alphaproteobacteria bacterium]|nr:GMC family oxidoreductase N-terminal domain-containing protein [Alphaproteobacteria bacterium]
MTKTLGPFDYVIVGAGTAGCVLANRLSADPAVRVCLLEAGGNDNYIWVHIPVGYLYCMGNPRTDWGFKTEAEAGLNGRTLNYPRGRILGGCSAINGMIYMRGQARDYDGWRQRGNTGWGWDDVVPYFLRSEDQAAVPADDLHNEGGEWRVERQRLSWEVLDAFREAAAEAGIPKTDDFNRGNNEGCGYFHVNQRSGVRISAAKAFLKPAMKRPNLTVFTHAQARRLRLADGRVTGVDIWHNGEDAHVAADGEVVLATGSVGSPQLLELSGIGGGALLQAHGIDVVCDLPGVGENLQDHLQIRCAYKVHGVKTLNEKANKLVGKASIALEYALFRRGPMSMAPSQLGAFVKSDPALETPDLQYHVQPLSLDKFGEPLHDFPAITASVCNLRPESRGTIHIASADARQQPAIRPNYLSTAADQRVAARAIRVTRNIVAQPSFVQFRPEEFRPGPDYGNDDDSLVRAAGDVGTTIFHPVGTARMGDDALAVVDDRLRVHGVAGLRVVDASVMPTITSGNTNSPVTMIAEKASDMMREDRRA